MYGRYTLTDPDPRLLRFRFGLTESVEIEHESRYNVAPTDPVLAYQLERVEELDQPLERQVLGLDRERSRGRPRPAR